MRALAVVTALALAASCSEPSRGVDAGAGRRAKVEGVLDLAGDPVDVFDPSAAAIVLLFVSTDCPIANRYAPTIRELVGAWADAGVKTWLVYPDPDDDPAAVAAHQVEFDLALPTVRDPEHKLVAAAGVRVTPEAAVFEPSRATPVYRGRIDDRVVEFGKVRSVASVHDVRDAVQAVLAGRAPRSAVAPAIGCYISDLR